MAALALGVDVVECEALKSLPIFELSSEFSGRAIGFVKVTRSDGAEEPTGFFAKESENDFTSPELSAAIDTERSMIDGSVSCSAHAFT